MDTLIFRFEFSAVTFYSPSEWDLEKEKVWILQF